MDIAGALAALASGDSTQAESQFRAILAHTPHHPVALQGLGKALLDQLRLEEAEYVFGEAIAVEEIPARAQYHLGLCRLLRGDYEKGWQGWEKRLEVPEVSHVQLDLPRWSGGAPPGTRLLVASEQGYGDTIQFSRFVPRVVEEYRASVVFLCPAPLVPLYESWNRLPQLTVRASVREEEFDSFVSICSLASIMNVQLADLPGALPALSVAPEKTAHWRSARPDGRRAVGLCWEGRPTHPQNKARSLSPDYLLPLKKLPDVALIGLQRPPCARVAPEGLLDADWGPDIRDFSDLAAMLLALDAVIAVDTVVAHLAGALGRPTFLNLPYLPDWRWLLRRQDSPWYPSVRLSRQPGPGDWAPVIEDTAKALHERFHQ